jgi:hypothetical protein
MVINRLGIWIWRMKYEARAASVAFFSSSFLKNNNEPVNNTTGNQTGVI